MPSQAEKDFASHVLDNIEVLVRQTSAVRNKLKDTRGKSQIKLKDIRPFIVMAANYTGTYSALGTGQELGQRIRTILLLNEIDAARTDLEVEELWATNKEKVKKFREEFSGLVNDVLEVGNMALPAIGKVVEGKDIEGESLEDTREVFYAYCVTITNLLGLFPNSPDGHRLAQEINRESETLDILLPSETGERLDNRHSRESRDTFEKLRTNIDAAKEIVSQWTGKQN